VTVTVTVTFQAMRSVRSDLFPVVEGPCKRYAMARHVCQEYREVLRSEGENQFCSAAFPGTLSRAPANEY
jgi:hypothetical protein